MASYELIPILFALVMIYITFYSYKRKQIAKYGLIFWNVVWIISILLVAFHTYVNQFLNPLNIMRVFDLYTIVAFLLILFIVFYLFRAVSRIEKKIENLARIVTIKPQLLIKSSDKNEKSDKENKKESARKKMKNNEGQ